MKKRVFLPIITITVIALVVAGFTGQKKPVSTPENSLEKRIAALESEIENLKAQLSDGQPADKKSSAFKGEQKPFLGPRTWTEGTQGWEEDGANIWTSAGTTPVYNVGIGTAAPAYKLDVKYNASIFGYIGGSNNAVYGETNTSTGDGAGVYGVGTHDNSVTSAKGLRGIATVAPNVYASLPLSSVAGSGGPGGWFWGNNKSTGSWWSAPGAGAVCWGQYGVVGITNDIGYGGVFGQATEDGSAGVWGMSDYAEAYLAYFDGLTDYGLLVVSGSKSCAMATSKGNKALFSIESPEVLFVDYGSGKLNNGKAYIPLDPTFLEVVTIDATQPYRVVVTPTDACNGLYVIKKESSFEVVEIADGTSNVTFDYQVIAHRKGYENKRFPEVKLPKRHRAKSTATNNELRY
jgi:hypothetical protein